MAFQMNYQDPADMIARNLRAGQEFGQNFRMNPMLLEQQQLANQMSQYKNQYEGQRVPFYPQFIQAEMAKAQAEPKEMMARTGLYGAQANQMNTMLPEKLKELQLQNQYYPGLTQADINYKNAMAQYGGNLGAGAKEEQFFQSLLAKDNPNFSPQQTYEASNAVREGRTTLSDGTPITFSPAARDSLNRQTKYGTTSPLITQGVQAAQAEAEMPILKNVIDEANKNYGTTIWGTSPKQIADAAKINDDSAQKRIGVMMAAQLLSFDQAAMFMRINNLPPGVTLAEEMKKYAYQTIDAKFPLTSNKARKYASDKIAETAEKILAARRSVDTGAASVRTKVSDKLKNDKDNDPLGIR